MKTATAVVAGIAGLAAVGLCCSGPALLIAMGTVSFVAAKAWFGHVAPAFLVIFLLVVAYALWRRKRRPISSCNASHEAGGAK